ncbi:AAA family ATPase [Nocardia sp. NPDC056000]|uniref:helix-turn-helix transcriptional regulator n=1 Tax=Nocardia sp. NPDC056000 TaxID=3345674 RepID=UPI0035DDE2D2
MIDIDRYAVPTTPLLGRDGDMARVRSALDGSARVVLIRGEAGIGKSRVLTGMCERLTAEGWNVVRLGADELDRPIAYSGLRAALAGHADPALECGALTGSLVRLLDVATAAPVAAITATARVLFGELTEVTPVLLAVDDLELLDADTLALVTVLLRQPATNPLVLLGNLRTVSFSHASELPTVLHWSRERGQLREIELGPMGDAAIGELVTAATLPGGIDPAAAVATVAARSGGNPLFALQALVDISEFGIGGSTAPVAAVAADDRRRAFLDRVLRVDHEARLLARAVALMGMVTPTRMGVVAAMTGLEPRRAALAFDALIERRILVCGSEGGYRVVHQFVRDVLCGEIGPAQRWHWQRLIVEHLYTLPQSPETDLEIAAALHEIAEVGDDRAIEVLTRAAVQAGATAPRAAVPLFERAAALTRPGDPRAARLRSRLAGALLLAGRPQEAATVARTVLPATESGAERARLVTLTVDALVLTGALDEAADLIDAAVAAPDAGARLLAKAAHIHAVTDRPAEPLVTAAEQSIATEPIPEQIAALGHLIRARVMQSDFGALPELWRRLADAARTAPAAARLGATTVTAATQAAAGYTEAASATIAQAQSLATTACVVLYREDLTTATVYNALHLGDWASALSIAGEATADLEDTPTHRDTLTALTVEILAQRGEFAAAERALADPLSTDRHAIALREWARAALHWLSGDVRGARQTLVAQLDSSATPRWRRSQLLARLAAVETDAGARERGARLAADLLAEGEQILDRPTLVLSRLVHGWANADPEAVADGVRLADAYRLELLRGQGRLWLAELDADAEPHLMEAARIFGALSAAPWRRRTVVELRRRGIAIPRARTGARTTLTETEAQIARLVQQGRRNREIAESVFLSVKTIERYLTRIYEKTGTTSRFELARAVDGGLLD